jgi:hypothetical protein
MLRICAIPALALAATITPAGVPPTTPPAALTGSTAAVHAAPVWTPTPSTWTPPRARKPSRQVARWSCPDPLARLLHGAGFRGEQLRTAWAIAMRESGGHNLDESSRWYTGALGIFQVQTSAHAGKPWWSRSAMLDPARQARLVYLHLSARGTDWRHWGIGPGGSTDTTYYANWSADQVYRWITAPFQARWAEYPCR